MLHRKRANRLSGLFQHVLREMVVRYGSVVFEVVPEELLLL